MQSEPGTPSVRLTWTDPTTGERHERAVAPLITIGRAAESGIALNSSQVSSAHARIEREGEALVLVDLNSTNGTFVADQRITRAPIEDGATFRIGPFTFTVDVDAATVIGTPPPAQEVVVRWTDPVRNEPHEITAPLPVTIGREMGNTIMLPGAKVSRRHAAIEMEGGQIVLADRGSANGTFLNGQRVQRSALQSGATVGIGEFTLTLEVPGAAGATVVPGPSAESAATVIGQAADLGQRPIEPPSNATLIFSEDSDDLVPAAVAPIAPAEFPPPVFKEEVVSIEALKLSGFPLDETTYLTVGGGLGSFFWADHLVIFGADPAQIVALGLEKKPHGRYQRICRYSQIPDHERLRSDSGSCPDNIWGWPGYAVREIGRSIKQGQLGLAGRLAWQIFTEPSFADTYTPRSGDVFRSIDEETARIGWDRIWRYGRARAIRKTDDGRYVIAYSQTSERGGQLHKLILARYVHVAVGYPGVRFLPDLQDYRERTNDFKSVVNAYEEHEHVYSHLQKSGGTVMIRGRGIVASRILQKLYEVRQQNPNVAVLHLLRTPLAEGNRFGRAQREVEHHWEFQPFNWPKATWGGVYRRKLELADDHERDLLLNDWGGTTTASRKDWRSIVNSGLREGWYQIRFGDVGKVDRQDGKLVTTIKGKGAIREESQLYADYIVDCTGLDAAISMNPFLN
ncbi:MAG TPA: FHA domain-containing protein, partial [Ardenticatenaceae bacterium]|nr:FHA domain-containing protein [Ardenticatenaceae bacterium]